MKAVVFHDVGDIRLEKVKDPKIEAPTDAIVRITASAICGTDLHMVRGTLGGMKAGTILGHEGVGIVEEVGEGVRNLNVGDRVVIPSTIACGICSYCRAGYYAQCDNSNPQGKDAGTAFFGGPEESGPFDGLQAELARVPFASTGLVKLPEEVSDDQAILISDIFPTGYFGAELAEIKSGDAVAVFGCGPVGQFAIASAKLLNAGRIFAIDMVKSRLEVAKAQGAEIIDFNREDPVETIKSLTGGIGVDRVIDAVGVDSYSPLHGPALKKAKQEEKHFEIERNEIFKSASKKPPKGWHPGNAPNQVLLWAIQCVAKAGTIAVIGVYPTAELFFPLGDAVNKNLAFNMGNCNHRKYIPKLIELVRTNAIDPASLITQKQPLTAVLEAYRAFEEHEPGWLKVKLELAA